MAERIVFPDIEKTLVDYLTTQLAAASDTAHVSSRVQDPRPPRMVRVVRNDGKLRQDLGDRADSRGPQLIIDRPRVVFDCIDDNGGAGGLASLIRTILTSAIPGYLGTVWCDSFEVVGIENATEPATLAPRHVLIADLSVRGALA
ncbi:hypothetical protein ACIBCN_42435 [Nocardia sp. NPDC051052]|uniref:hypothetical protein n=1 Tax=Nocardia sp. NPDC051052 TaxID=3364322 RepID=UPI003799CE45